MKSIKPGRGPSKQAAAGSVFQIVFGLIWTVAAGAMTAGFGVIGLVFPLFGLAFVGMGVYNLMYHGKNAQADVHERDSLIEIVDSDDYQEDLTAPPAEGEEAAYCPWCGEKIKTGFLYCPKCGKKLP